MKRKLMCLMLSLILCLSFSASAHANSDDNDPAEPTNRAELTLAGGLSHVSGNTYSLWGRVTTTQVETLYVRARLYKVVDGNEEYVTQISGSATARTCSASKNITLLSGHTYIVRLYATGNTQTKTKKTTYNL